MAIETQFTIRSISVEQALKEAEAKVDHSAKKMDTSLNSVGSGTKNIEQNLQNAAKGMDSISKAGGKAGGIMKNLTESITGILSPIGLVSAAITGVIALVVSMYEKAKEKMQSLIGYSTRMISEAKENQDRIAKEQTKDSGYMERLIEISHYEHLDNATKEESIRIIEMLTDKYGDLGLSINETTGEIVNLVQAQERFNQKQLEQQRLGKYSQYQAESDRFNLRETEMRKNMSHWWKADGEKLSQNDVADVFSPLTPEESRELLVAQQARISYGRAGMTPPAEQVATPLNDQRLERASDRWYRFRGGSLGSDDEAVQAMRRNIEYLEKLMEDTQDDESKKDLNASYTRERDWRDEQIRAYQRAGVASEMAKVYKGDAKEQEKWFNLKKEANEYYDILQQLIDLEQQGRATTNDPNDPILQGAKKQARELDARMKEAEKQRTGALQKQYSTETAYERSVMSKGQLQEAYELDNSNVLDLIESEKRELDALKQEYDAMTVSLKEYEGYKNAMGDIEDKAKNAKYLELSNKITANKLAQVEAETRIAEAQTEQLGIQAKLNAVVEQQNKEQRDKITNQMKATMKGLFSNVLGDMKERTDSLALRGGYIGNTTNINPVQVNRQILNTVMTANNYLASIKQALADVGRIK
jgi:hypothetical protein